VVALPRSAFHLNAAVMLLKNAARDPQSQAGADVRFGGEKWLEDILLFALVQSRCRCRERNADP